MFIFLNSGENIHTLKDDVLFKVYHMLTLMQCPNGKEDGLLCTDKDVTFSCDNIKASTIISNGQPVNCTLA